jgi:IS30 family transposase
LDILEYCDIDILIEREQFYIDLFKPDYNILKIANSRLNTGNKTIFIHQKDFSIIEYPSIRCAARSLGISHTTLLDYINSNKLFKNTYLIVSSNTNTINTNLKLSDKNSKVKIKVFDNLTNLINEFGSLRNVTKFLSKNHKVLIKTNTISNYIKSGKFYRKRYYIYRT